MKATRQHAGAPLVKRKCSMSIEPSRGARTNGLARELTVPTGRSRCRYPELRECYRDHERSCRRDLFTLIPTRLP